MPSLGAAELELVRSHAHIVKPFLAAITGTAVAYIIIALLVCYVYFTQP